MPKLKPHKGLLKRVKITGKGKVRFKRAGASHLNGPLSGKKIRDLRKPRYASAGDKARLEQMLHRRVTPGDR